MPHLLFKLNGVPEDEEVEVRQLLDENHIDYYETSAGRFGISLAALWIRDGGEIERARELLDAYQERRYTESRARYEQLLAEGKIESLYERLLASPVKSLLYLLIIIAVLLLSTLPFIL